MSEIKCQKCIDAIAEYCMDGVELCPKCYRMECDQQTNDDVWNAAIEAAADVIDQLNREGPYQAIKGASEIRKLKR